MPIATAVQAVAEHVLGCVDRPAPFRCGGDASCARPMRASSRVMPVSAVSVVMQSGDSGCTLQKPDTGGHGTAAEIVSRVRARGWSVTPQH